MEKLKLYGFGYNDRSGKIRWTAEELEIPIEEVKIELGEHRKPEYRKINPFATIPSAIYKNETMIESTASCVHLAESLPEAKLAVFAKEADRYEYLKWISLCSESLEGKLVDYILANNGLMPEEIKGMHQKTLEFKCRTLVEQLPDSGFLVADRFTIADIVASYSLKLAVLTGFIEWQQIKSYLEPLIQRDAAIKSRFFEGMLEFVNSNS